MEFGSSFVFAGPDEYETPVTSTTPASPAPSSFSNLRRRLRGASRARDDICTLNVLDTYSFGRMSNFSFESLPDAVGGQRARWRQQCVRDSDAVLLVYDVTNPSSFDAISGLYEECCRLHGATTMPAVLCANFSDMLEEEAVSFASAISWGRPLGIPVFRTSARTGLNVDTVFVHLVRQARRQGRNMTVTILGAQGAGKTSMAVRFCYPSAIVEDFSAQDEPTYTREILVPGIQTNTVAAAPALRASARSAGTAPGKLRKKRSVSVAPSRISICSNSTFGFGSRKSMSVAPPLPNAPQESPELIGIHSGGTDPLPLAPAAAIGPRKADCNIVALNLGTLAPDDSNVLSIRALRSAPAMCPVCSARCRGTMHCAFCGTPLSGFTDTRAPPAVEEYWLDQQFITISWSVVSTPVGGDDVGAAVFCIDVYSSMAEPHELRYEHHMWRQAHGRSAKSTVSRLECMQDAVLLHLERIHKHHPQRKVAILLITSDVDCTFSGMYATHRVKDGHISSLKQGINHGESVASTYWKELAKGYSELARQIRHLRPSKDPDRALGTGLSVALGLARANMRDTGTKTEIYLCTTGSCNAGVGRTQALFADAGVEHGRQFYQRAAEQAESCNARLNLIGIAREDTELGVVASAVRGCGGVCMVMDEPKVRREPRHPDRRRVIARNVVAQLFVPCGCRFTHARDPRPGININKHANIATVSLAEVDDDSFLSFSFVGPDTSAAETDSVPFQAQIQYTNSAGDTVVRIVHSAVPATRSRHQSEMGANVSLVGIHVLWTIAAHASVLLADENHSIDGARILRDELRAGRLLLERLMRNSHRETLARFLAQCERLDCELEAAFEGPLKIAGASRDLSVTAFANICQLKRSILATTIARRRATSAASRMSRRDRLGWI